MGVGVLQPVRYQLNPLPIAWLFSRMDCNAPAVILSYSVKNSNWSNQPLWGTIQLGQVLKLSPHALAALSYPFAWGWNSKALNHLTTSNCGLPPQVPNSRAITGVTRAALPYRLNEFFSICDQDLELLPAAAFESSTVIENHVHVGPSTELDATRTDGR